MEINKTYITEIKLKSTHIKCATKEEKFSLGAVLVSLGENTSHYTFPDTGLAGMDMGYPCVYFDNNKWCGHTGAGKTIISFTEFLHGAFSNAIVEVVLNKEHKAVFKRGDNFVQVGCQQIPVAALEVLLSEIKKLS